MDKKYLIYGLIGCLVVISLLLWRNGHIKSEKERYEDNYESLLEGYEKYRTKDSLSAISVSELELKKKELEKQNEQLVKACEDMGIKIKRLESASMNGTETVIEKIVPIHDTLVRVDTAWVTYQAFSYKDSWNSIEGLINGTDVNCKIDIRDTLVQVIHRIPHKFLFFKWGAKEIRQDCRMSNPYTNLEYSQYIKIK